MIVSAWRIVKARYAAQAFTGEGARTYGGRWNSPGGAVVYVSGSLALATLELLVHLQSREVLGRYVIFEVKFDERLQKVIKARGLHRRSGGILPRGARCSASAMPG